MTTDEVVLRREKAAENGEPFQEPPPRLRGQSTYLALLSSLASDLDIMLNDLRSSSNTSHQLQTRSQANISTPPVAPSGGIHTSNDYLQSALLSNKNHPPQSVHLIAAKATKNTATPHYTKGVSNVPAPTSPLSKRTPSRSKPASPKFRTSVNCNGNSTDTDRSLSPERVPGSTICGLSPDVRRIQKLPLWSYQQKQLQQPQKLHVQVLQQQHATKAIRSVSKSSSATNSAVTTRSQVTDSSEYRYGCGKALNVTGKVNGRKEIPSKWTYESAKRYTSGHQIEAEKFRNFALNCAKSFVQYYPWYNMPTTLHKYFIHGPEVIAHALLPIGQLSEEAQEARNKDFKAFREYFSRKCSREKTNEDILNRLLISSDPIISTETKLPHKKVARMPREALDLLIVAEEERDDDDDDNDGIEGESKGEYENDYDDN